MFRYTLAALMVMLALSVATPAHAWRGGHGWGFGPGFAVGLGAGACCGYYPYYSPYYAYPAYAAQPTVVYETAPAPVTYVMPPQAQAPVYAPAQSVAVSSASTTFTDREGRTCRHFQSTIDNAPVSGTACLQQDGSWHTVNE